MSRIFKLKQCCDLLQAAGALVLFGSLRLSDSRPPTGYHRVRIATLSPFDRVVGGLCWCITVRATSLCFSVRSSAVIAIVREQNSGVDVNVDILFEENSTIGQRMCAARSALLLCNAGIRTPTCDCVFARLQQAVRAADESDDLHEDPKPAAGAADPGPFALQEFL